MSIRLVAISTCAPGALNSVACLSHWQPGPHRARNSGGARRFACGIAELDCLGRSAIYTHTEGLLDLKCTPETSIGILTSRQQGHPLPMHCIPHFGRSNLVLLQQTRAMHLPDQSCSPLEHLLVQPVQHRRGGAGSAGVYARSP